MPTPLSATTEHLLFANVLARHAHHAPQATAVRFARRRYSYAEMDRRTRAVASRLWHEWGVRTGDRVAWLGANHVDQVTLLFALARIGAVLVPLNFRLAPAEWDGVLADCTPCCVVHDASWRDAAQALAARAGIVTRSVDTLVDGKVLAPAPDHGAPDAPALLVYTSGTTGEPKGAVHSQGNLLANMVAASQTQEMIPTDVVATVLPMFHVGGLCIQTLPALYAGASVILHERFEPGAMLVCIAQDRPSLTLVVPAVMKALVAHPSWAATDLSSLRAVWAGSSTLPLALVDAFHARGLPVCNVYGATETGPFSIALGARHAMTHPGSCGWPVQGVEVRLADISDGVGELLLRAPNIVQHYWPRRPALDAQGWFHSGDLGMQAADGSYSIVGRSKDMIISGGENIYPAEIENLLAGHAAIAECAVVGLPDAKWGEVAVAACVCAPGAAADSDAVMAFLAARIARYKLPRRIVWLDALPKTALGKVQKPQLVRQIEPAA
ncbi:MAG: AMP-binding protein [Burkholderiaceae bacterium]|nr:AMP-binding protein [Burkholderiaceae bacterium]